VLFQPQVVFLGCRNDPLANVSLLLQAPDAERICVAS